MRINKNIEARLRGMMICTLSYYSAEARCDGENDLADQLYAIAERISTGTETEEDWLEAIITLIWAIKEDIKMKKLLTIASVAKKQTNADRIRSMSNEELLDFICSIETYDDGSVKTIDGGSALCSVTDIEKWLQLEVEKLK